MQCWKAELSLVLWLLVPVGHINPSFDILSLIFHMYCVVVVLFFFVPIDSLRISHMVIFCYGSKSSALDQGDIAKPLICLQHIWSSDCLFLTLYEVRPEQMLYTSAVWQKQMIPKTARCASTRPQITCELDVFAMCSYTDGLCSFMEVRCHTQRCRDSVHCHSSLVHSEMTHCPAECDHIRGTTEMEAPTSPTHPLPLKPKFFPALSSSWTIFTIFSLLLF